MDVAVVDFIATDAPERFTASLRETGFAVLVNHPLPWSLVERIYRAAGEHPQPAEGQWHTQWVGKQFQKVCHQTYS